YEKYRPENDSRDTQTTVMLSTANDRSVSNTPSAERARTDYALSSGNPHAYTALDRDYITSEDTANQYTFEVYLDELSTVLGDVLCDENLVPQVDPVFYPNVEKTTICSDGFNASNGTEEISHQYTLQELLDEYDRVVESTTVFPAISSITEPSVLQIPHDDHVGECEAEDAQNPNISTSPATVFAAIMVVARLNIHEERLQISASQCTHGIQQDPLYIPNSAINGVAIHAMAPQSVGSVQ
ncbi:MAG: hypothetical protein NXY57DRAFT_1045104, partial [Lentinula lateritia]